MFGLVVIIPIAPANFATYAGLFFSKKYDYLFDFGTVVSNKLIIVLFRKPITYANRQYRTTYRVSIMTNTVIDATTIIAKVEPSRVTQSDAKQQQGQQFYKKKKTDDDDF